MGTEKPGEERKNKLPQRRNPRHRNFDYSTPGAYFITIVAHQRKNIFGRIENGVFHPGPLAEILLKVWKEQPLRFANVCLDAFAVMPNHFHAVVWILPQVLVDQQRDSSAGVLRYHASIPTLLQACKSALSRLENLARGTPGDPVLQRSYYDHIVRHELSLDRIREYIFTNPLRWHLDKENPQSEGADEFDIWYEATKALETSTYVSIGGGTP